MIEWLAFENRQEVQNVLAYAICIAALIWGAGPERIVAGSWLVVFEGGSLIQQYMSGESHRLVTVDWPLALMDMVAGAIWIAVALYANRNYTLWIAGLQLLAMIAHLSRALTDLIAPIAYAILIIVPGWLQLVLLAFGLIFHVRRKRRFGRYRDWRRSTSAPVQGDPPMDGTPDDPMNDPAMSPQGLAK